MSEVAISELREMSDFAMLTYVMGRNMNGRC